METGFPKQLQCLKLGQSQNTEVNMMLKHQTNQYECQSVVLWVS